LLFTFGFIYTNGFNGQNISSIKIQQMKKLFLLDAYALIYRAYFAFIKTPRINSKGQNTSAAFGFTNTLSEILKKEKPDNIAVVFDPPGGSFRNQMYPQYKAQREAMPEDLRLSIPWIKSIVEGFNIPCITIENYEADDVVGTLAKQAAELGYDVYMMTLDKDYCQLVDENIRLFKPKSFGSGIDILGIDEVNEKFGVETPAQVIDILGLWGDSSDNIPGAPGIGEKRAKELIAAYGSIEGIYDNIEQLKGKQKENLLQFKEQVLLSKDLATIRTDVPVEFCPETTALTEPDAAKLSAIFADLEFGALAQRVLGQNMAAKPQSGQLSLFDEPVSQANANTATETAAPSQLDNLSSQPHHYLLIETEEQLVGLLQLLSAAGQFCFDTETTGLDPFKSDIVGIAFSMAETAAYYLPVPEGKNAAAQLMGRLAPIFCSPALKIGQNLKFDISMLMQYGIEVKGPLFDTMLAHYLLQPEGRHNLDTLAASYLSYQMQPIEELIGKKGASQIVFSQVPIEKAKEYACEDADICLRLKHIFEAELRSCGLYELFSQIEMPLVPVLARMEYTGVKVDTAALAELSKELNRQICLLEEAVYRQAGRQFNIASPKQLGDVLFTELRIADKIKMTKTKQFSTSEETLSKLRNAHPIIESILEYRSLKKLTSTYIDSLPKLVSPATGRIHSSYNQAVVATGRLSSNNPNLQNIPIRSANGREVRRAFIPSSPGRVFLSADYSQIELRLIAHFSGDPNFIEAFQNGEDIHAATAAKIFKTDISEISSEQRSRAKGANFGIVYGISAFGLSQNLGISRAEADELIKGYFSIYPGVREYMDSCIEAARANGYVCTMFGRRRYLPDISSQNATMRGWAERNAVNAPVQGTGADIIKKAMVAIDAEITKQGLGSKLIMQVHDELNFDVPEEELDTMMQIVKHCMERAAELKVPLTAQMGSGQNWLAAH
jgi:DNA polymerase I